MGNQNSNQECCPKFNPAPWDDKTFSWDNKRFVKDKVLTIFNLPLNFGPVIKKIMAQVEKAGATTPDNLCLSDHSKWKMDIYVAVDKEIPEAENVTLSGRFYSRVYEGNFKETGKWCQDFEVQVKNKGLNIKKWYMWYTTCPKCAKKYGENYVVIIGQVE